MGHRRESLLESVAIVLAALFGRQRQLARVRDLPWRHFETLLGEAFSRRGYSVVENGGGASGAVDLALRKDGEMFFVQCRQRKVFKVRVKPVRELVEVIAASHAAGGFFVCSSTYSARAREFAERSGIELIDGPALEHMVSEAQVPEPFMDPTVGRRRTNTTFS